MAEGRAASHILVLDAAEGLLQFVIAGRGTPGPQGAPTLALLCAEAWHAPSQGAELLAPALAQAFERLRISPRDIGRIACVRGPGSFTGLRLVLSTAAGLARATGALRAGIDYLPLLAGNAFAGISSCLDKPGSLWVLTHARRQLVHLQGFSATQDPLPLTEIIICSPGEAVAVISETHATTGTVPILLGSGLYRNRAALEQAFAEKKLCAPMLLPPIYSHPSPQSLLSAADSKEYSHADVAALYARPSDAEENLENIAASLGLDPVLARNKLSRLTGDEGGPI